MAQITADAVGGRGMMNVIAGGMGYVFMASVRMLELMKKAAADNTMKNALNKLVVGGEIGNQQTLSQVLADAQIKNQDVTLLRFSLEDCIKFQEEANLHYLPYHVTVDINNGMIVVPEYRKEDVNKIISSLKLTVLEDVTSTRDLDKAVEIVEAESLADHPEYENRFARYGESKVVAVKDFDFGKADPGKIYTYDLGENGLPKDGSVNPMTGRTFARGDVFYKNGKINAENGRMVGGVKYNFNGQSFVKCTALPTDDIGVLKDTIPFYDPEQYKAAVGLKGDAARSAYRNILFNKTPNDFNKNDKFGSQTMRQKLDWLNTDASVFRSIPQNQMSDADIMLALKNDIRNIVYVDFGLRPYMMPFVGKNRYTINLTPSDKSSNTANLQTLEKSLLKAIQDDPNLYKMLDARLAANPNVIRCAVLADPSNWDYIPGSVKSRVKGINKNAVISGEYKSMIEAFIKQAPSKAQYVITDDKGDPRPALYFIKTIPPEFLNLFTKDEMLGLAAGLGHKLDLYAGPDRLYKNDISYEIKARKDVEALYSKTENTKTVFKKLRFSNPGKAKAFSDTRGRSVDNIDEKIRAAKNETKDAIR